MSSRRARQRQVSREGKRFGGRAFTYGAIPPRAGPARLAWCAKVAQSHYAEGTRNLGTALVQLTEILPRGLKSLPKPLADLHVARSAESARSTGRLRVTEWFALRERVAAFDRELGEVGVATLFDSRWEGAERAANDAVRAGATAFHCMNAGLTEIDRLGGPDNGFERQSWLDALDRAHALVHTAGELVGGLFGCKLEVNDGHWMNTCGVAAAHIPLGMSAGFTARHVCTVCNEDLIDCPHQLGIRYTTTVVKDADGECSACAEDDCDHMPGSQVSVVAQPRLVDLVLYEISATPNPRDPRNRIESIEVSTEELVEALGRMPRGGERIWSHACIWPCTDTAPAALMRGNI